MSVPNQSAAKAVFILGAGASKEFGLPTGDELKKLISGELLKAHVDDGVRTPDNVLGVAIAQAGLRNGISNAGEMAQATALVARAMPQVQSIDNFLYQHAGDRALELCSKLTILKIIFEAERKSKLVDQRQQVLRAACPFDPQQIEATWANRLIQILFAGCRADDLDARLKKVAFVVFNYDRCLEHFLYHSLQNVYGRSMPPARAAALVNGIEVHHPYGSVGVLDTLSSATDGSTPFGAQLGATGLVGLVDSIRTFSESTSPAAGAVDRIQDTVRACEKLVFLGFSFGEQNLELLLGPARPTKVFSPCLGTCFEMSLPNVAVAKSDLQRRGFDGTAELAHLKCGEFVSHYSGHLRFL